MIRDNEFWAFMNERESIRLSRLAGTPREEWTTDPIFKQYSFTNIKRHHDRTTMLLDREFYRPNWLAPHPVKLLNAVMFRYFGTISFARTLGWHNEFTARERERMCALALAERTMGRPIFTAAYIIRSDASGRPKHEFVAETIESVWRDAEHILQPVSWEAACGRLQNRFGVGSFMAKEFMLDYILASHWVPVDWETWTPVGPGARLGAGVVMYDELKPMAEPDALMVIRELYKQRDAKWNHDVRLDLTDIQFQLCEFAKYTKAKTGVGKPKKTFSPTEDDITRSAA